MVIASLKKKKKIDGNHLKPRCFLDEWVVEGLWKPLQRGSDYQALG